MADSPGALKLQRLRDAGIPETEVQAYKQTATDRLVQSNAHPSEVEQYWGDTPVASPTLDRLVQQNMERNAPHLPDHSDPLALIGAGWDNSNVGRAFNGRKVVVGLPEHAGLADILWYSLGQIPGDLPATTLGFIEGAAMGAKVPGPPQVKAFGAAAGAGGLGATMSEALRQVQIEMARDHKDISAAEYMSRASAAAWTAAKSGIAGAAGGLAGGIVGPAAGKIAEKAGSQIVAKAAPAISSTAELATFAVTGAAVHGALEGHMPEAQDYAAAVITMVGLGVAGHVVATGGRVELSSRGEHIQRNMQEIYARTGVPPWEQAQRAQADPAFRQEILAPDVNGDAVIPNFRREAPPEPEPFRPRTPVTEEAVPTVPAVPAIATVDRLLGHIDVLEGSAAAAKRMGVPVDQVVSPAGAIGRYQVMPNTARQYMGKDFDVRTLTDPAVNERVTKTILADLSKRYKLPDGSVDTEAVLIAYNAGPGRADVFRANGRDYKRLPAETQRYLERADRAGMLREQLPGEVPAERPAGREEPVTPERARAMTIEELQAKTMDIVATPDRPSLLDTTKGLPGEAYSRYVSRLGPAKWLDKALEVDPNTLGFEDVFRSTHASSTRAGMILREGPIDPFTFQKTSNDNLFDAFKLAKKSGGTEEGFLAYRLAAFALEKAEQGVPTGVDLNVAKGLVEKTAAVYDPAAKMIGRMKDGIIDYEVKAGMRSPESAKALKTNNRYHITHSRVFEDQEMPPPRHSRNLQPRDVVKTMKGSERQINQPVEAEINAVHQRIANADKNVALLALVGLDPRINKRYGVPQLTPEELALLTIRRKGEGEAPKFEDIKDQDQLAELLAQQKGGSNKEFHVFVEGKKVTFTVGREDVAAMIRGGDKVDIGLLSGIGKWFASLQRSGITLAPDYILKTVARDLPTMAVISKHGGWPAQNLLAGMFHVLGQTETYKQAVRSGVMGSTLAEMDVNYVQRDVHAMFDKTGVFTGKANAVRTPLEAARLVFERLDAMSRVGRYVRRTKQGVGPLKAAMEARVSGLDYAEAGTSATLNKWASMTPFLRTSILGPDQLAHAISSDPLGFMIRGMAYITMPSVSLRMWNYEADKDLPDGEKYTDLDRWVRDMFWVTPPIGGNRIYIPKPREIGMVFGSLPERLMDWKLEGDPRWAKDYASDFANLFFPSVIPAAAVPIAENVMNYSIYRGKPLIPASLETASNYMQYTQGTSLTARALTKALGPPGMNLVDVSPIVVDNYVRQWFGGLGQEVLRALDAPQRDWKNEPDPVRRITDLVFVSSFLKRNSSMSAAPVSDFYDGLRKIRAAHRDLSLAIDRGDESEIDFTSGNAAAMLNLTQTAKAISQHMDAIRAIDTDPDMSPDEKRQETERFFQDMVTIAKDGNQALDEFEADERATK